jgi:hypothetical protein
MIDRLLPPSRTRAPRRLAAGAVLVVVSVLGLALGAVAYGAGSSLKLKGPTSNELSTNFSYKISGYAAAAADYVVAWEQLDRRSGCATTNAAESTRAFALRPTAPLLRRPPR